MKRILLLFLVLLVSCNARSDAICEKYKGATLCANMEISAETEGGVKVISLYTETDGESSKVKVTEPESIAGISAKCENGKLSFDEMQLELCEVSSVSPLRIAESLLKMWRSSPQSEGESAVYVCERMRAECKFDENLLPVYAEIYEDGRLCMRVKFLDCEVIYNEQVESLG